MKLARHSPRCSLPAALALALAVPAAAASPAGLEFSDGFLLGGESIDMSRYANGNPVPAGIHAVDVYVNDTFVQSRDIHFQYDTDPHIAQPCLPADLLPRLSLKAEHLQALQAQEGCVDLLAQVEGATVAFDSAALRLSISVPQAAQARTARGYVAPAQRDAGITAAFIDYSGNHYRSNGSDSSYLGLHAGINLGNWRLRHRTSFNRTAAGTRQDIISSHLQRDLPAWNSQLLLGQGYTGGELFESIAFTGARVATDERMLPDSLRGFAPVVQGIAEGNALVAIRQNGRLIHEVNVAPGPFSIEDLYPTSFGGDLEVTVTEADGRQQRFTVNFSAVPQALRPGAVRFSTTAGQLHDNRGGREALPFAEATYARGISNHLTALGGLQVAQDFHSALVGGAVNTPIGAFGADITHSRARLHDGGQVAGNSIRLNYQRYMASSGTHFGLAALRYSTRGYLTLDQFAQAREDSWGQLRGARQRFQANLSQRLGERSTLSLSGGHVRYWNSARPQTDFQLSLQSRFGRANYSVSAQRYQVSDGRQDTRYSVTFSLPLGTAPRAPRLSTVAAQSSQGAHGQLSLTGTAGADQQLSYSASASDTGRGPISTSAFGSYRGGHGSVTAGYSRTGAYSAFNASGAGSVVLHRGGVNFGASVGEGFALVQADGAQGARIGYGNAVRIGRNGYALLPHISPYRWNQIELDPSGLPMEVELLQTSQRVAPTAGSIVRVAFNAKRERILFIDATDALGQPLPYAARLEDDAGRDYGVVGQGGVIQLRGAPAEGSLIVDPDGPGRCRLHYTTPDTPDAYGLSWSQSVCMPLPRTLRVELGGASAPAP